MARKGPSAAGPGGPSGQRSDDALGRASSDLLRRVPPRNLEAEQAVLGGILLHGHAYNTVSEILEPDDFYSPAHRHIFSAFAELSRKSAPIDLLTLREELARQNVLDEIGGEPYLADLAQSVVTSANTSHHAQIVKEKATRRQLIDAAAGIIEASFEGPAEPAELLDQAQQAVFQVAQAKGSSPFRSSKVLVDEVITKLAERFERQQLITGVSTGFARFDELTAGLQPTDLIIVAGRPSMGKTAFAMNMAMNAALFAEIPTAVFSLEMGMDQLMMRMLCIHGLVDLKNVRTGFIDDHDWEKLHFAADALSRAPIWIDDTPALTAMELRSRCRRIKAEHGLGLVVVDYLQLMRASRRIDSREQEISDISRNLKALAKELHVPVVALSQLNRKVEERTNKRPMLADLRESGAIEQDADVICFIYRDEVYNENTAKKGIAEIIVGKQRNGPIGTVELAFIGKSTAFRDLSHLPEPTPSEGGAFAQ